MDTSPQIQIANEVNIELLDLASVGVEQVVNGKIVYYCLLLDFGIMMYSDISAAKAKQLASKVLAYTLEKASNIDDINILSNLFPTSEVSIRDGKIIITPLQEKTNAMLMNFIKFTTPPQQLLMLQH